MTTLKSVPTDPPLTLILNIGHGVCLCLFWLWRQQIHQKKIMRYQSQYFASKSRISECDQNYKTRNTEPQIRTYGSSRTLHNPQVGTYGSSFGLPTGSGSGIGTGLGLNNQCVGSKPGPLACYPDLFLAVLLLENLNWISTLPNIQLSIISAHCKTVFFNSMATMYHLS